MSYECPTSVRQPFKRSRFQQLLLSEQGVRNASPIPGMPTSIKPKYKAPEAAAVGCSIQQLLSKESEELQSIHSNYNREFEKIMHFYSIPVCNILLLLNLQLFSTYPISSSLTYNDMDTLKVSLRMSDSAISGVGI